MRLAVTFKHDMKSTRNKTKSPQGRLHQTIKPLHSKRSNKMRSQPMEWEKIFANHISEKGLLCRMFKELFLYNSIKKIPNTLIYKSAEELDSFPKKAMMSEKYMKRCSTSLIIRKTQIETTMTYYFTRIRMTITEKTRNKCW